MRASLVYLFTFFFVSLFFLSCSKQENSALSNQLISFNTEEDVMTYSLNQGHEYRLRLSLFQHTGRQFAMILETRLNEDELTTVALWKVLGTNLMINPIFTSKRPEQNYQFDTDETWELFLSDLAYSTLEREILVDCEKVLREVPQLNATNFQGEPVLLQGSELISAFRLKESVDLTYLMATQEGFDIK
jgi:hypothetical protein